MGFCGFVFLLGVYTFGDSNPLGGVGQAVSTLDVFIVHKIFDNRAV